jgi:hypothetical protein
MSLKTVVCTYVVLVFLLGLSLSANNSGPIQPRIINRQGRQISAIFYGTSPDPRVVYELKAKGTIPSSCSLLKTVYHESARTARLRKVGGPTCGAHYQVDYFRNCSSGGGGGTSNDDWTFGDSMIATWCDGYDFSYTSCPTGNCRDQFTCFSDDCL